MVNENQPPWLNLLKLEIRKAPSIVKNTNAKILDRTRDFFVVEK